MHDPQTVAFEIRYPWRKYSRAQRLADPGTFMRRYREPFITIWHVDPERDGTDDSCGWFIRARHLDQKLLSRIVERFTREWDRTWKSDASHITYNCGLFDPRGAPALSVQGIVLNLFFLAAIEVFGDRDKAMPWLQRHVFEILLFAENTSDSLYDSITMKFGRSPRSERITELACIIYGWIARQERPWWRHPRWHVWHWRIQVHPWRKLRRWLLTRCVRCRKRFGWDESPCTNQWNSPTPKFLRGEVGLYHGDCGGSSQAQMAKEERPAPTDIH